MKKIAIKCFSLILTSLCAVSLCFGDEKQDSGSLFDLKNFDFEKSLVELYEQNGILSVKNYPKLRRLAAKKVLKDCWKTNVVPAWGEPDQPFMLWLDKHQDFLETYLTTIDLYYVDLSEQMRLMKRLWSRYPELVEKHPELTIAMTTVWDDPNSFVFRLCHGHYDALPPSKQSDVMEMFQYYADKSAPFRSQIDNLSWEFLIYIVCHKTSEEERRWVWKNYGGKKTMLGKSYDDPLKVWKSQIVREGLYADTLMGIEYTLPNIKKRGTVCSGRTDYACGVCRTLGVPTMNCWGTPKYAGGHYWVQWLELRDVAPKKVSFSIKSCGRDDYRRDHYAHSINPETAQEENDGIITLRLGRAGKDIDAYRHGELLMKHFETLVKYTGMTPKDQLDYLLKVNAVLPGNQKAWNEITAFARKGRFDKTHVATVKKLFPQMVEELLFAPNELPKSAKELLDFPEIKKEEKKLYALLINKLGTAKRDDLVFEAALNYADSLAKQKMSQEEFNLLSSVLLKHSDECDTIEPVLKRLEDIAEKDAALGKKIVPFYQEFLNRVTKNNTQWTKKYQIDMLLRSKWYFDEHGRKDLTQKADAAIARLQEEKRADDKRFHDFLDELDKK